MPTDRRLRLSLHALALSAVLFAPAVLAPSGASAFEAFATQVPCRATTENSVGTIRPCITCHNNPDGGGGCGTPPCFNPFGSAFNGNGRVWNETLATGDADGDGYTNGEELGDPTGTWRVGDDTPGLCDCATRPGFMSFTPGDTDADMDGYCCRGTDMDSDGDCLDPDEHDTAFDCDDAVDSTHSLATEVCANTLDNDCDGLPTLLDEDCASVVDRDGDGYCFAGIDLNRDRDCIDSGETTSDSDCDDDEVTVSPGAREFCVDMLDNDCDTFIDILDDECTSDTDADDDGFCPIGRDLNDDGDCNDTVGGTVEAEAGFDCDDSREAVNPDATEICTDMLDNDCDGLADFRDEVECGAFFDADLDGYCPAGRDGDGDGNCTGEGEADEPGDCDDDNPDINPGEMENCVNGDIDDDCDMIASLADEDCAGYIDTDGDRFCGVGVDMDGDGTCAGEGEANGNGDCDETNPEVLPTATEICTDIIDNDCDGSSDANDRGECDDHRDIDGDGFCLVGQDLNDDGDCSDEGERSDLSEWSGEEDPQSPTGTEGDPTRYPGAPENCTDMEDDDLDGMVDEGAACVRDTDADGDGWCPLGQDVNGDGDCLDEGENIGATDCNDNDPTVNPGEPERCLEPVDADCDSEIGTDDTDCFTLLDRDGDGFCPTGIDDNADGDCLDLDEDRFGVDCDDTRDNVNSRQREDCTDGLDNDCDGDVDYDDSQCDCEDDAACDDGDPCTLDMCGDDGACSSSPDPMCTDAGMPMVDGGMMMMEDEGCGCRTAGRGRSSGAPLAVLLLGVVFALRRRRRNACR
ncbi:MAG: MopE-related protein [Sandaracinaceae bacterium]